METRARWYRSQQIDAGLLKSFADVIASNAFVADSDRGFIATEVRPRSIAGRFIQRIAGDQVFRDAFGGTVRMPYVTFETTTFRLSSVAPQIELRDAPRGARRLFQFLEEKSGSPFAVDMIQVDPISWIESLVPTFGSANVRELGCRDLAISPSLVADMTFTGSGDILASSRKFLGARLHSVKFARAVFDSGSRQLELQFQATASIKTQNELPSGALVAIREALRALV